MSPELRAILAVVFAAVAFSSLLMLVVLIGEIRRHRRMHWPKHVVFDWQADSDLAFLLDDPLFDSETEAQLEALANALRLRELLHGENRARASLYAVPNPNVTRLPNNSDARVSPDAA